MKYFSALFWLSVVLFATNQVVEASGIYIPYVHSYLDDLLCSPITLGFALFIQQQFTYQNKNYTLSYPMVIVFVIWYSFIFELVLPQFSAAYKADVLDVLAYALGSFIFIKFGNMPAPSLLRFTSIRKRL